MQNFYLESSRRRRVATAADKAAKPVPKSTTVTGSGIGTGGLGIGPSGVAVGPGGVGSSEIGVDVFVDVGALIGVCVLVGVPSPGVLVLVGVLVGVSVAVLVAVLVGVAVFGSIVGVSAAGAPCAYAKAGDKSRTNTMLKTKATTNLDFLPFMRRVLLFRETMDEERILQFLDYITSITNYQLFEEATYKL